MYRHFATVTVAITALLAFFANGENHEAVAANAGEQRAMVLPAAPKPRLEIHRDTNPGSWADDGGEVMGQPSSPAPRQNPFALDQGSDDSAQPSALDREDGDEAQTGQALATPTAAQIAAATAASRLRSGARGID